MAIQIFGSSKSFDTKKAERWFSERRIAVQKIDLKDKGIARAELESVVSATARRLGSRTDAIDSLADKKHKDYASFAYLDDEDKFDKLLDNPMLLVQPLVRNGKTDATAGFCPEIWQNWQ